MAPRRARPGLAGRVSSAQLLLLSAALCGFRGVVFPLEEAEVLFQVAGARNGETTVNPRAEC